MTNTQQLKLIQQSQSLIKTIREKDYVSFEGIKELIKNPKTHKKFSVWQGKGLVGIRHNAVNYFTVKDFNNFLTGVLPENKYEL